MSYNGAQALVLHVIETSSRVADFCLSVLDVLRIRKSLAITNRKIQIETLDMLNTACHRARAAINELRVSRINAPNRTIQIKPTLHSKLVMLENKFKTFKDSLDNERELRRADIREFKAIMYGLAQMLDNIRLVVCYLRNAKRVRETILFAAPITDTMNVMKMITGKIENIARELSQNGFKSYHDDDDFAVSKLPPRRRFLLEDLVGEEYIGERKTPHTPPSPTPKSTKSPEFEEVKNEASPKFEEFHEEFPSEQPSNVDSEHYKEGNYDDTSETDEENVTKSSDSEDSSIASDDDSTSDSSTSGDSDSTTDSSTSGDGDSNSVSSFDDDDSNRVSSGDGDSTSVSSGDGDSTSDESTAESSLAGQSGKHERFSRDKRIKKNRKKQKNRKRNESKKSSTKKENTSEEFEIDEIDEESPINKEPVGCGIFGRRRRKDESKSTQKSRKTKKNHSKESKSKKDDKHKKRSKSRSSKKDHSKQIAIKKKSDNGRSNVYSNKWKEVKPMSYSDDAGERNDEIKSEDSSPSQPLSGIKQQTTSNKDHTTFKADRRHSKDHSKEKSSKHHKKNSKHTDKIKRSKDTIKSGEKQSKNVSCAYDRVRIISIDSLN